VALRQSPFNQEGLRFAPDGRHYSFVSNESGRSEVYVSTVGDGSRTSVSSNGGRTARWSADGRELYYISGDRRLISMPMRAGATLDVGTPVTLFAMASMAWQDFDVSRDGRFLALIPEATVSTQPLTAVQHWDAKR
jgi:dipeptidyl aminopeptidase/acylaminoacyl peptidase